MNNGLHFILSRRVFLHKVSLHVPAAREQHQVQLYGHTRNKEKILQNENRYNFLALILLRRLACTSELKLCRADINSLLYQCHLVFFQLTDSKWRLLILFEMALYWDDRCHSPSHPPSWKEHWVLTTQQKRCMEALEGATKWALGIPLTSKCRGSVVSEADSCQLALAKRVVVGERGMTLAGFRSSLMPYDISLYL